MPCCPGEVASVLSQLIVDAKDPAFSTPTKPIGPIYAEDEAQRLSYERGWPIVHDGAAWRRVVASPRPLAILRTQRDLSPSFAWCHRYLCRRRRHSCCARRRRPPLRRRSGDRQRSCQCFACPRDQCRWPPPANRRRQRLSWLAHGKSAVRCCRRPERSRSDWVRAGLDATQGRSCHRVRATDRETRSDWPAGGCVSAPHRGGRNVVREFASGPPGARPIVKRPANQAKRPLADLAQ